MVCVTSKGSYAQSDQSLCLSLEYSMNTEQMPNSILEFLSLKAGCSCSIESTHVAAYMCFSEQKLILYFKIKRLNLYSQFILCDLMQNAFHVCIYMLIILG